MSQGTTFRVIAFDKRNSLSKDEIMQLAIKDQYRSIAWGAKKSEEETKKEIEKNGMAPFLPFLEDQNEEDRQYNQYRQKADPFPMWVDTKTGFIGQELLANDFTSDFDKLYEHFHLQPESPNECIEITKTQVVEMLRILDYIKLGKYDKNIEDIFLSDNEFFYVFEHQFFHFSQRFIQQRIAERIAERAKIPEKQTITIVIKDENKMVDGTTGNCKFQEQWEDTNDYEEEENLRSELGTIDYLRSVLSAFLMFEPRYHIINDVEYKLVYHKWI